MSSTQIPLTSEGNKGVSSHYGFLTPCRKPYTMHKERKQKEKWTGWGVGGREIKLSLFINEKIGEQKPVAFLYINNELFQKK